MDVNAPLALLGGLKPAAFMKRHWQKKPLLVHQAWPGVQAPLASWGTLVTEGSTQVAVSPWVLAGPGLVMGAAIFALNFVGDGLRDALDPQSR